MQVKRSSTLPGSGPLAARLSELSTAELLRLARSGSREAFDPLYRRFADRLMGYMMVRTRGDRALSEDITSEVWARVIAYSHSWEERAGNADHAFFGLLAAAARQRLGAFYTGRWYETCYGGSLADDEQFGDSVQVLHAERLDLADPSAEAAADGAGEDGDRAALAAQLRAAVDRLCLTGRQVVQLRLDGLSNAEIAARLDMDGHQVSQIWQRSMRTLRNRVGERFTEIAAREPDRVRAAAETLPEPQCKVALLRLDGVPEREVAERVGISYESARRLWTMAKDGIRRRLADPQFARTVQVRPEERIRLHEAAQRLPVRQCEVALLRLAGQRPTEIARQLGCSPKAVTSRWIRARAAFERQGLPVAA